MPLFRIALLFNLLLLAISGNSQAGALKPLTVAAFTTASQLPGGNVAPLHPGLEVGTEFYYKQTIYYEWLQTLKLGAYRHRLAQTGIQLYTEAGYRRWIGSHFGAEATLGAGYLHAIPDLEVFKLENGRYEKQRNRGRPQAMASFALAFSYRLGPARLYAGYQFFLQFPFVKSYVPVLPNTAIRLGVAFPCFGKTQ